MDFLRERANTNVLIHCAQGFSRSPALALGAAFIVSDVLPQMDPLYALMSVLARAPNAWPNDYLVQLVDEVLELDGAPCACVTNWKGSQ